MSSIGISGGQRKRVSIAMELMKQASVLLLDEPTSGLDSANASILMEILYSLGHTKGTTIITTLHQPRSEILHKYVDSVMLLASGGRVAFQGKPCDIEPYLTQFSLICPVNTNIADFAMDILGGGLDVSSSTTRPPVKNSNQTLSIHNDERTKKRDASNMNLKSDEFNQKQCKEQSRFMSRNSRSKLTKIGFTNIENDDDKVDDNRCTTINVVDKICQWWSENNYPLQGIDGMDILVNDSITKYQHNLQSKSEYKINQDMTNSTNHPLNDTYTDIESGPNIYLPSDPIDMKGVINSTSYHSSYGEEQRDKTRSQPYNKNIEFGSQSKQTVMNPLFASKDLDEKHTNPSILKENFDILYPIPLLKPELSMDKCSKNLLHSTYSESANSTGIHIQNELASIPSTKDLKTPSLNTYLPLLTKIISTVDKFKVTFIVCGCRQFRIFNRYVLNV